MISIDPGIDCYYADWDDEFLLETCGPWGGFMPLQGDTAVIETQVIRPKFTKNPASIIELAHRAGAVAAAFGWPEQTNRVKWVTPSAWKGNTKKPTSAARWSTYAIHRLILEALSPEEIAIYTVALERLPEGERHNLADAVGIGLHELGRLPAPRTESPRRRERMAALAETLRRQAS